MCIEYKQTEFDVKNSDSGIIGELCLESFAVSFFMLSLLLLYKLLSVAYFFTPTIPTHE